MHYKTKSNQLIKITNSILQHNNTMSTYSVIQATEQFIQNEILMEFPFQDDLLQVKESEHVRHFTDDPCWDKNVWNVEECKWWHEVWTEDCDEENESL